MCPEITQNDKSCIIFPGTYKKIKTKEYHLGCLITDKNKLDSLSLLQHNIEKLSNTLQKILRCLHARFQKYV